MHTNVDIVEVVDSDRSWRLDLWQHLKDVKLCSFSKAIKRKKEVEADAMLCDSLGAMRLSRVKDDSLETKLKKLCIGNEDEDEEKTSSLDPEKLVDQLSVPDAVTDEALPSSLSLDVIPTGNGEADAPTLAKPAAVLGGFSRLY